MFIVKSLIAAALSFAAAIAFAAVDVNKASQAELESVKGIGPSMSSRILEARKTGAFADWNDLQSRVKGVGTGNAKKFSADGLTVNGAAFTPGADAPAAKASKSPAKTPKQPKEAKEPAKKAA